MSSGGGAGTTTRGAAFGGRGEWSVPCGAGWRSVAENLVPLAAPQKATRRVRALAERFIRFGLIGGLATAIQYAILVVLVRGIAADPVVASAAGFCVSAGMNYGLNYRFTFRSRKRHRETLAKFMTLAVIGLALNSMTMALAVRLLDVGYLLAQLFATALVLLWNFLGNEFWTFRQRP